MKKYVRPDVFVTEFQPNIAVASCERDWTGETSKSFPKQPITCCRRDETTDYIFTADSAGCMVPCHSIYVAVGGTYSVRDLNKMGLQISGSGGDVTVPAGGGYVLCWDNGNHYGPASTEVTKIMTNSY